MTRGRGLVEQLPEGWIAALAGLRIALWLGLGAPTSPEYSQPAFLLLVFAFTSASVLLVWGARDREPRARSLALAYLLVATTYTDWGPNAVPSAPDWLASTMRALQPSVFLPFAVWTFCSAFPQAPLFANEVKRLERVRLAAYLLGVVLFVVSLIPRALLTAENAPTGAGLLDWVHAGNPTRGLWVVLGLATLPALLVAALRTRRAPDDERRRVSLFLFGILVGGVPPLLQPTVLAFVPALSNRRDDPSVSLFIQAIEYSGLFFVLLVSGYAILARRALNVRFIVRRTIQYALARNVVLALTALPFIALAVVAYHNRERPIGELFADTELAVLFGFTVTGLALARFRRFARTWIDRMFFREQYDARRILAGLVYQVRGAPDAATLARLCTVEIDRALHVERVALLYGSPQLAYLVSGAQEVRPLATDSWLLDRLRGRGQPLDVDWELPSEVMSELPPEERVWLTDAGFRLLLPLHGAGHRVIGLLGLGEKRSELPYSREDRDLLVAIAGAAALAFENRLLMASEAAARPQARDFATSDATAIVLTEPVGRVCSRCGIVQAAGGFSCEHCAGTFEDGEYPLILAGKYELIERIGRGGMGIVFRARDRTLGRDVAIKTLPEVGAEGAARLRREARAMASLTHPNLAVILAAEVWHGTPYLVVEYLPGGTLVERLRRGPLGEYDAIAFGITIASVLERVHRAGILHRDVKPGNIGYGADGTPKLLDFGLARLARLAGPAAAHVPGTLPAAGAVAAGRQAHAWAETQPDLTPHDAVVGTVLYLSPEALNGEPSDPSVDLWSTNVMLYECIAGRNPFHGSDISAVVRNILQAQVPDIRSFQPTASGRLAGYFRDALERDHRRRPKSAKEIRDRLARMAARAA
jgi:hypothetical protein